MSKSVYIHQDLADKTIRYTNLGVMEADEFRKILILQIINQFE